MMKTPLIKLLITIMVISASNTAFAGPNEVMRHPEKPDSGALAQLNLSHEQTEKIKKLRIEFDEAVSPLIIQEHQAKAELDILWLQMKPDVKKIKSAQKKIHDIRFQILEKETDFRIALREVLTQEQLSRFLAFGEDRGPGPALFDHRPPPPPMQPEKR